MMVVAAAIEYADGRFARSKRVWERKFVLTIPVSEPDRWCDQAVLPALLTAMENLAGPNQGILKLGDKTYVCNNMTARDFSDAFDADYSGPHVNSYREYAIAGTRHMDELAILAGSGLKIERHAKLLECDCGLRREETVKGLRAVFYQHTVEWKSYLGSLHPDSFARQWTQVDP